MKHTCNLSPGEAEGGGSHIPGQPRLYVLRLCLNKTWKPNTQNNNQRKSKPNQTTTKTHKLADEHEYSPSVHAVAMQSPQCAQKCLSKTNRNPQFTPQKIFLSITCPAGSVYTNRNLTSCTQFSFGFQYLPLQVSICVLGGPTILGQPCGCRVDENPCLNKASSCKI